MSDKLIFTIGFTDEIDKEWAVQNRDEEFEDGQVHYNVKKMVPEIEKWNASWEIDMSKRHNQVLFHNWETIIRAPHLKMVDKFEVDVPFVDDYKNMNYQFYFLNLIPIKSLNNEIFDYMNDTENCFPKVEWGALHIDLNAQIMSSVFRPGSMLQSFLFQEEVTELPVPIDMRLTPKFNFNFEIGHDIEFNVKRYELLERMHPSAFQKYQKYADQLTEAGWTTNGILNCTHNTLIEVGKLIEDPIDIIDKIYEAPYICRASLTKPE